MTGKINIKVWMTILVLSVFLIGFVSAFGVSSDYWVGNPLKISPGETKTISLRLQNIIGAEDIKVKAILKDGQGIATTESKDYLVKAGTNDTEVPITVSIPSNIPLGNAYQITLSFDTVTSSDEGAIFLGTGMDTTFDVLVAPAAPEEVKLAPAEETKSISTALSWTIGLIILLVLIFVIIKIFRKKKK